MREKVIIDIYDDAYKYCKSIKDNDLDDLGFFTSHTLKSVANGTPFDSVIENIKAEIDKQEFTHHDGLTHWYMTPSEVKSVVFEIIDRHIGDKADETDN